MHVKSIMEALVWSKNISTQKALLKLLDSIRYKFCLQNLSFIFQAKAQFPSSSLYPHIRLPRRLCFPAMPSSPEKRWRFTALFWEADYIHQLGLEEFWRLLFCGEEVREGIFLLVTTKEIWVWGFIFIPGLGSRDGNWVKTGTSLWLHLLFFSPWDKLASKSCFETLKFKP